MTQTSRKLATIVALDVAGYSALIERDEAKTAAEIAALRGVIERQAALHQGRVFNTAGDGFMLEFASSAAAVEAALELAETCDPKVRVGVHLGDVVVQPNGDLLGHGVNVAARLMARAEPGSALISADVRRTVRGPIAQRLVSRGLLQLDKMTEQIEAFTIGRDGGAPSRTQSRAAPPLLAVLAFDNLSTDPEMQFFSEGVAEEILQTVSRIRGLGVIGRSSSFQLHGSEKAITNVARLLKATHVLDGAVRRSGNKLRVSAQLVECAGQTTLWNDRYDRELTDVFVIQDEIAQAVAATLDLTFKAGASSPQLDATTLDLYLRAGRLMPASTLEATSRAVLLLEHAVEREPRFASAWGLLAQARAWLSRSDAVAGDMHAAKAALAIERTLTLDPASTHAVRARAVGHPSIGRFAQHEAYYKALCEGSGMALGGFLALESYCLAQADVGRLKAAATTGREALVFDPLNVAAMGSVGRVLALAGAFDDAQEMLEAALKHSPDFIYPAIALVVCAAQCKRFEVVDRLLSPDWLNKHPLGRFERPARATAAALRNPSRDAGLQVAAAAARSIDRYGWANFEALALAAHLGAGEEVFALVDQLTIDPARARSATVGVDIYQTHGAFTHAYPEIRRDPRFVQLCHKAGLVDYWLATQRWPDCASEVAGAYDFKAACAKVAAG